MYVAGGTPLILNWIFLNSINPPYSRILCSLFLSLSLLNQLKQKRIDFKDGGNKNAGQTETVEAACSHFEPLLRQKTGFPSLLFAVCCLYGVGLFNGSFFPAIVSSRGNPWECQNITTKRWREKKGKRSWGRERRQLSALYILNPLSHRPHSRTDALH